MSYVEPTAAVLFARTQTGNGVDEAAARRAFDLLIGLQHPDGGWGIGAVDAESGWMTAWAVLALARDAAPSAARGAEWLLRTEGLRTSNPADVEGIRKLLHIDASLVGWPWQVADAAWIFPTALALMALHAAGRQDHPRVQEGVRFLLDRAIASGGWNVGNPVMLNAELPATIVNTSLVLIALGEFAISGDVVTRGRDWLGARLPAARTAPEVAWGLWASKQSEGALQDGVARLDGLRRGDGSWDGNPFTTAVAVLAGGGYS